MTIATPAATARRRAMAWARAVLAGPRAAKGKDWGAMRGFKDPIDVVAVITRLHRRRSTWSIVHSPLLRPKTPYTAVVDTRIPGLGWAAKAHGLTFDDALIRASDEAQRREQEHIAAGGQLL